MRRAVALVLVAALGAGCQPKDNDCGLPNRKVTRYVFDGASGKLVDERSGPLKVRTDGLFRNRPVLPAMTVPRGTRLLPRAAYELVVRPVGRRPWSVRDAKAVTQLAGLLVLDRAPTAIEVRRVEDGAVLWRLPDVIPGYGSVKGVVDGDLVVLVQPRSLSDPFVLARVSARTGTVRWRTDVSAGTGAAVTGRHLVVQQSVVKGDAEVGMLDLMTGHQLWLHKLPHPAVDEVALDGDDLVVDNATRGSGGCG